MRRRGGGKCIWGRLAVVAGIAIILALLLPPVFWWMVLAVLLIGLGIWFLRCG